MFRWSLRGKRLLHLITLTRPQHPIVDENTSQLVADRSMGQRRRHRRIHPAAQRTNHSFLADLLPNLLHRRLDIRLHRPGRLAATDIVDEIPKNLRPFRRMRHFGMKLKAIDPALGIVRFIAAMGELSVWAMDRNPGGIRSIRSPCDIQTTVEPPAPMPLKRSLVSSIVRSARPYSRWVDLATSPPERCVTSCMP